MDWARTLRVLFNSISQNGRVFDQVVLDDPVELVGVGNKQLGNGNCGTVVGNGDFRCKAAQGSGSVGMHLSPLPEPSAGRPNAPAQKVLGQFSVQGDLAR